MSNTIGMGWLRDYPDYRDFTPEKKEIEGLLKSVKASEAVKATIPANIDLRRWCSPIENQANLGSCTANAGVGVLEYFERRAHGRHIDASRLFLYKVTRNLLGWTGDTGAFLRTTMAAMVLFGVPPTKYWPYNVSNFDIEPNSFCYAFAQNFQAISYYRLDPPGLATSTLLVRIKRLLASGLPSMFGFTVYNSISQASDDGLIPYPGHGDRVAGGHAIVAVGYDDNKVVPHALDSNAKRKGALLIRNSWGTNWGDNGYGWLPYAYVTDRLAVDWWSLISAEWINTNQFGL